MGLPRMCWSHCQLDLLPACILACGQGNDVYAWCKCAEWYLCLATPAFHTRESVSSCFTPALPSPYHTPHLLLQDDLTAELQCLLDEAGVDSVQALLPSRAREEAAARRPRTARVNTLKMSVAEALAWLRNPPPGQQQQRWKELVSELWVLLLMTCNLPAQLGAALGGLVGLGPLAVAPALLCGRCGLRQLEWNSCPVTFSRSSSCTDCPLLLRCSNSNLL